MIIDDVEALSGMPIKAQPINRTERAVRWCRRNPLRDGGMHAGWRSLRREFRTVDIQVRNALADEADANHFFLERDGGPAHAHQRGFAPEPTRFATAPPRNPGAGESKYEEFLSSPRGGPFATLVH